MTRAYLESFPVRPVLAVLGLEADPRGRYFCPWHDDEATGKPSADVWGDEDELLGCWSCGHNGDAVDVVMAVKHFDRAGARALVRTAVVDAPSVQHRERRVVPAWKLEDELRRLTTHVRYPHDVDPVERFATGRKAFPPVEYLRTWQWAGDYRGRVVMPHRTVDGTLTGLRFRVPPDWEKDSRRHSRFSQLYGAWRLRELSRHRNGDPLTEVWLVEGETDVVWTAWHLEPRGVTVLGLPGAGFKPDPRLLDWLRARTVVLAMDGDAAGQLALERWRTALNDDVVSFQLKPHEDMCDKDPTQMWEAMH